MTLSVQQELGRLAVTVTITNTDAGHHVPTDFPGRHMILVVTATNAHGQALPLRSGETVPAWGGPQSGQPGKAFAKVLRDVKSGEWPVVNYWKQALIVSDNRIAAMEGDTSVYGFAAPSTGGPVTVTAELHFRRVFQEVMDAKGWGTPDILMEAEQLQSSTVTWWEQYLPLVVKQ
jgi:hypothetical protein